MALKKCKECGGDVSSKAESCPRCGRPLRTSSAGCTAALLFLLIIGILIWVCASSYEKSNSLNQEMRQLIR